jgi:uncharacterized membrane protein
MSDQFPPAFPPTTGTPAPDPLILNGQTADFGRGFGWISDAFGLFMKAPGAWLLFALVVFVGMFAVGMVPFIGQLGFNLVSPLILAGVITVCRNLERGEELKSEDFLVGFSGNPTPLLIVGGLYLGGSLLIVAVFFIIVIATVGTAILAGLSDPGQLSQVATVTTLLMLMVAALVALALYVPLVMAFWFATPLVYFHGVAPVDAMKASFMGCLKNILPFLLYGVVSFVLLLISVIPLGLGLLVMMPVLLITVYTGYKDIYLKA